MNWNHVFAKGLEKVDFMEKTLQGKFPHITKNGKWLLSAEGHWTGGFWVGLLWLNGIYPSPHPEKLAQAQAQAKKLSARMQDNKTHDMGFIFGPSCIWGSRITGDQDMMSMAIKGAHNLEHLYDERSGAIYAWDEPGYQGVSIVDTIMNLPILVWASDQADEHRLREMALNVADQIAANHIRKDFSTYHVVRWNTEAHRVAERTTHQGYSADSCWSRGHAWALYGFANMYRYTLKDEYLEISQHLAEYFWNHVDTDTTLPRWDFIFQNHPDQPLDAAAASIAASGMLLLSQMMKSKGDEQSRMWSDRAEKILTAMTIHCFYQRLDEYGIIRRVTVDKPRNSGVNESSMYGDYYFMEAVFRLLNRNNEAILKKLY